jgi:cysteine synthase A
MVALCANHTGVEERCLKAYGNAKASGDALCAAVKAATGHDMPIHGVTAANAAIGFTSSTYSFNLPPKGSKAENEALAQNFTDLLCAHKGFKPCVSFGQDNDLVYCTVPATSTQGAIAAADKAKQEVGGV